MCPEYKARTATALAGMGKDDVLIISGGITRPDFPSEAMVGLDFITKHSNFRLPKILLEKKSTTTGENIRFVKELLEEHKLRPDQIFVYHRQSALLKTKILYDQLWKGHPELVFVPCVDTSGRLHRILEYTLMPLLAYRDPYEQSWFWRWFKRTKRNANV